MRYHSTYRPVAPGGYPKPEGNRITDICNFDSREYQPSIDRRTWGYIEYERPLPPDMADEYELMPEGIQLGQGGTLGREEYYHRLHERYAETDWNDQEQVRQYNEYARRLRSQMEWED